MSCGTLAIRLLLASSLAGFAGCQLTPRPALVECPLPIHEQAAEIVRVVPLGTSREDVLKELKAAGIYGNFGENESIFYCDIWQRNPTVRWHTNVELLFNEDGKLYATRPTPGEKMANAADHSDTKSWE